MIIGQNLADIPGNELLKRMAVEDKGGPNQLDIKAACRPWHQVWRSHRAPALVAPNAGRL
jgi:hypothetical protein